MKSRNNIAIVLLLTMAIVLAFTSTVSANGFISGTVLDNQANPIADVNVTATNGTNVFYFYTNSIGVYVITIPTAFTNRIYNVKSNKVGYYGNSVQTLLVTDLNTTVAQNIVMTKETTPATKVDTLSLSSIPADKGVSSTVITATIRDQDGNLLIGGTVNSSVTARVNFFLRNGSLDVTTGNNGSLLNTGGGIVSGLSVRNVPIDSRGNATITLRSGNMPGTVNIFNNVTVRDIKGNEVNATITVVFTPLQGQVTGTVRSSESVRLDNATVTAYRLLWTLNTSTSIWTQTWEPVKSTVTDSFGDYVVPFINLKFDVIGNTDISIYEYNEETTSIGNTDVPPPLVNNPTNGAQLLTNIIKVIAVKNGYNNGWASDFVSVDETETMDVVLTSGQPDEIYVSIDGSIHQINDINAKTSNAISTWIVTTQLKKSGQNAGIAGQEITFIVNNPTVANFGGLNTIKQTTDSTGKATVILTSTINSGTFTVNGYFTTRDNLDLYDWDVASSYQGVQISGDIVDSLGNKILVQSMVNLYHLNPNSTIERLMESKLSSIEGHYAFVNQPLIFNETYMVNTTFGTANGSVTGNAIFGTSISNQNTVTADIVVLQVGIVPVGTISGTVTNNSNGLAIPGASIYVDNVLMTTTNSAGSYSLTVNTGSHTIKAVAAGYINGTQTVNIFGGTITLDIELIPSGISLVDSYLPPGGTAVEWKAGVIQAMDDYFAEPSLITKDELLSVMDAYFS